MPEFLVTLAVTFVAAPLASRQLLARGFLDIPNHRSSHTTPVPRGGGLACLAGAAAGVLVAHTQGREVPWLLVLLVVALTAVGFADDRQGLSAVFRLAAQVAAGATMGWALGGGYWILVAAIVVPVVVNVVNFMDGINGITSLTMAVWGITAFAVGHAHAVLPLSVVGALTAGSALGFLPWNAPTARLFLGDSGSYLFGALVGAGLLIGWSEGAPVVLLAAPLTLYLTDTGTVLAKRALRGDPLFEAHREHVYQRLTGASGLPHVAVSLAVAALAAAMTISWMAHALWIPLATTALACSLYLLAPRLVGRGTTPAASTAGGTG